MDHWRNQTGNKKISKDKWKQTNKNHDPKPMGYSKSVSERGGFSYFRKQEQFKVNYLASHLNQLEKEEGKKKLEEIKIGL